MKMEGGEVHFGPEQTPTGYERGGTEVQWVAEAEEAPAGRERQPLAGDLQVARLLMVREEAAEVQNAARRGQY
jgi:hypothetical protein